METRNSHLPGLSATGLDDEERVALYETMVLCQCFEQAILRDHPADLLALGAGREGVAAGVCAHLAADDALSATYRAHHVAIARGLDLTTLIAEVFGPLGQPFCAGTIGEGLPSALGQAFAFQRRGAHQVSVGFASGHLADQRALPRSLDLAAAWKLPVVFVVECADPVGTFDQEIFSVVRSSTGPPTAYTMPGVRLRVDDVESVYAAAADAVRRARSGEGPTLLEMHDAPDPVGCYEERLLGNGVLEERDVHSIATRSGALVEQAIERARGSPPP